MLVRFVLFASSFSVAGLIVGVRLLGRDFFLGLAVLGVGLLLMVPARVVYQYARRGGTFTGAIESSDRAGEALASYLVTYLLPIILVDPSVTSDVIAVGLFVVFLSVIYTAADLHYLNPLLVLVGLHVWRLRVAAPDRTHSFIGLTTARNLVICDEVEVRGDGPVRLVERAKRAPADA